MMRLWRLLIATLAFASTFSAHAGLEAGRAKAQICMTCHGADGNAVAPAIPSLAGQPRQFIVTALYMFREGRRSSEVMTPFAIKLTNTDLNDLAQFFNAQMLNASSQKMDAERELKARVLTEQNNCVACHTATLVGQQHIPRLAGQHKEYLLAQLKAFKTGSRADFDGTMTSAAQGLADGDLDLIAEYLSTR